MLCSKLPEAIIIYLKTFLSNDDYHYLVNSSKQDFADLKRRTVYFPLNKEASAHYQNNEEFRSFLLSKVENGWKQIKIYHDSKIRGTFYDAINPNNFSEFIMVDPLNEESKENPVFPPLPTGVTTLRLENCPQIKDVTNLSRLSKLVLRNCEVLDDITPLKTVPDLSFQSCSNLSDVSMLSRANQSRICLIDCPKLSNLSSLQGIRVVHIANCIEVVDVSVLHGVYDLSIQECEKVKDIRGLGDHHRLSIGMCAPQLIGYDVLTGIPHVSLAFCDITDVSVLRDAKSVEMNACMLVTDVGPLKNVRRVKIGPHHRIQNLSVLKDVYDLTIATVTITETEVTGTSIKTVTDGKTKAEEIIPLRNYKLHFLEFAYKFGQELEDPDLFAETRDFTMERFSFAISMMIEDGTIAFFRHLQSLTIQNTGFLAEIRGLEDIPTVRLINLNSLRDVSGLGRNRCVELRQCPDVTNVNSLAKVSIVTIDNCRGVKDYSSLANVPRLKIIQADSLDDEDMGW